MKYNHTTLPGIWNREKQDIIRTQRIGSNTFHCDQITDVWGQKAKHRLINKNVPMYQMPGEQGRSSHSRIKFTMMSQGSTVCYEPLRSMISRSYVDIKLKN